jgi:hypothetical protein
VVPIVPRGQAILLQPKVLPASVELTPKRTRNRVGNGHKKQMVRSLLPQEKDFFRANFLAANGMLEEKDCTVLKEKVSEEVAIFQVTGFISYLHRDVASGRTVLQDTRAYLEWMRIKYPHLLIQYNSERFIHARHINEVGQRQGLAPTAHVSTDEEPIVPMTRGGPVFKVFPRKGSLYRGS